MTRSVRRLTLLISLVCILSLPCKAGDATWHPAVVTVANTAKDGTGTVASVLTADAGPTFVYKIVARTAGTNAATVCRVFLNNGSDRATARNNILIAESTLESTTVSEIAAQSDEEIILGYWIPKGYSVFVTIGTAGTAGWYFSAISGSEYAALFTTP
jgi:hypothetical protein